MRLALIQIAYLLATALFVFALHWMNDPRTARRGVFSGVAAMFLAVAGTMIEPGIIHWGWIALALVLGFAAGVPLSRVPLTAVPQRKIGRASCRERVGSSVEAGVRTAE